MSDCNPSSVGFLSTAFFLRPMKAEVFFFFKQWLNLLHKLSTNLGSFPSLAINPFPLVSRLSSWIVAIGSAEARQILRFKDVAGW